MLKLLEDLQPASAFLAVALAYTLGVIQTSRYWTEALKPKTTFRLR
jgi:hypothetical protein